VTEGQYIVVHKYLFRAIAEVLGDAVTSHVAAVWDKVYPQHCLHPRGVSHALSRVDHLADQ
jgi:hemoglobin-like flavoprotein